MMSEEIWKPFPLKPDIKVSNMGRVQLLKGKKITKGFIRGGGYCSIGTKIDGKTKSFLVHRMVMMTFVGIEKREVNHKNGIKTDNRLENLEYCSRSENLLHAIKNKLAKPVRGSAQVKAKLTEQQVYEIKKRLSQGETNQSIADEFEVSIQVISRIRTGKRWKHIQLKDGDMTEVELLRASLEAARVEIENLKRENKSAWQQVEIRQSANERWEREGYVYYKQKLDLCIQALETIAEMADMHDNPFASDIATERLEAVRGKCE